MASHQDKLRETLDQLAAQLDEVRRLDPQLAANLEATIAGVKATLEKGESPEDEHRSLVQDLSDAMLKFEASHPTLAGNLGSVIDALGRMGI